MDFGDEGEERIPTGMPAENEAGPSEQPQADSGQETSSLPVSHGPGAIAAAHRAAAADMGRTRSPTPPRALYRSTTGKGVAFTDEDVMFLVRFLEYRTRQHENKLDMVQFWKEVAAKVGLICEAVPRRSSDVRMRTGASPLACVLDEVLQET